MSELRYLIRSKFPGKQESPAVLGAKLVDTVDALSRIDPSIFFDWEVMDYPATDSVPLSEARSHAAAITEKNIKRDDDGRPTDEGYTMGAFTGGATKSRRLSLRIVAGGTSVGEVSLGPGFHLKVPDLTIVSYPVYKAALLALIRIWPPTWACAYAFRMNYFEVPLHPGAPLFPYSIFHIPWLAYLSAPLAAGLKLAPEILTERTPDGGLLMIAAEERLDPANPENLRRARIIVETMMACTGEKSTSLEEFQRVRKLERELQESFRRQQRSQQRSPD